MREWLTKLGIGGAKPDEKTALVLSGGGARGAYQAGVLAYIAERLPEISFPLITGVSAGSINAAHLACSRHDLRGTAAELARSWTEIAPDDVFEAPSSVEFFWRALRGRDENDDDEMLPRSGLVDTRPLREFLAGELSAEDGRLTAVARNIEAGRLEGVALLATSYSTAQTTAFVQGSDLSAWDRANRVSVATTLSVDHILASTSLPFLFPAVQVGDAWFGDGGIRLADPLSPAIHMGADRILAISTRYQRSRTEARTPVTAGYPPSAQIFGVLMNAIFLDRVDQDAAILRRTNDLLTELPRRKWGTLRPIRLLMLRPSVDIGKLAGEYEPKLSGVLELLAGGLGSKETKSPDWLSMILFDPAYTERLIEIGYSDAARQGDAIQAFFEA